LEFAEIAHIADVISSSRCIDVLDIESNSEMLLNQWHGFENGQAIRSAAAEVIDFTRPRSLCELVECSANILAMELISYLLALVPVNVIAAPHGRCSKDVGEVSV